MNVAILGGSFDPPHNGHLLVAREVKRVLGVDEIWMIPVFSHPFNKSITSVNNRLAMTKLLEKDFIKVLDLEAKQQKTSFSIETLDGLSKQYPSYTFFWIIGSDQLKDFHRWKDWQKILTKYRLIIFQRIETPEELQKLVNESIPEKLRTSIMVVTDPDVSTSSISSSEIRNMVKRDDPIGNLVPKEVKFYIENHNLYKT